MKGVRIALVMLAAIVLAAPAPTSMSGTISHMGPGYPHRYLALPVRGEHTVELCGPANCVVLTQNDYGPDQRVHPDRIADVSVSMFEYLCDCPASVGLINGSWRVVGEQRLPETDT